MKKTIVTIVLIIGVLLLTSCKTEEVKYMYEPNNDEPWDVMTHGWQPPGRFDGQRDWDLGVHDPQWPVDFTITTELAREIGGAILKHVVSEEPYAKYEVYEDSGNNAFVVTRISNSPGERLNSSVMLDKLDGEILRVYIGDLPVRAVITQELALGIGDPVLFHVFGEARLADTVFFVTELPRDNCFVITRVQRYPVVLGGERSVAVDSANGRIINVFYQ